MTPRFFPAMPEALAVLAIIVVAVAAWVGAWMHARDPANYKPHEEHSRLQQHEGWLQGRLETARREKWSEDMVANLEADLEAAQRQRVTVEGQIAALRERVKVS